jgi:hypothetical protein
VARPFPHPRMRGAVTDDELKEQREAVLKAIYELRLLRPTMIGLLENYERWIKQRVAREAAEECSKRARLRVGHPDGIEASNCGAAIRAHFGLDPKPPAEGAE